MAVTHITLIKSYRKALKKMDKRKMAAALHCPLISEPYRSPLPSFDQKVNFYPYDN
jgi:hypothetical protein